MNWYVCVCVFAVGIVMYRGDEILTAPITECWAFSVCRIRGLVLCSVCILLSETFNILEALFFFFVIQWLFVLNAYIRTLLCRKCSLTVTKFVMGIS